MRISFPNIDAPVTTTFLGFGKVAVPKNTGRHMRKLIRKYGTDEYVRKWAERIIARVPDRDQVGEVKAIFNFMRDNTRYANDPRGTEYFQTPPYVLKHIEKKMRPSLDCDDYTITGLALLRSIGYATKIRIVGYNNKKSYSHVYGMVVVKDKWIPFDCVRKDQKFGWQAPGKKYVMDLVV